MHLLKYLVFNQISFVVVLTVNKIIEIGRLRILRQWKARWPTSAVKEKSGRVMIKNNEGQTID